MEISTVQPDRVTEGETTTIINAITFICYRHAEHQLHVADE